MIELTPRQQEVWDAFRETGSQMGAAKLLGVHHSTIRESLHTIERKMGQEGADPGFTIDRKTQGRWYTDENGDKRCDWLKSSKDKEDAEAALKAAFDAMIETLPREKAAPATKVGTQELLNLHILTDFHLGLYAWPEETGEGWSLDIAEDIIVRWFQDSIKRSPKAATGVLAQLGDLLHYDSMSPITPTGGFIQDTDSRYSLVVRTAIRVMRRIVKMMLKKYETVHVIHAEGNHDMSSSVWLRELFAAYYENEPRVIVDQTVDPYYVLEHGQTSLFFHHGHKRKPAGVDSVFVGKNREVYGRTKFSYAHLGHMHHVDQKETNLMIVEQHRTMAAKDAYATRGGWGSGRSAPCITYHEDFGEVGRITTTYEMLAGDE